MGNKLCMPSKVTKHKKRKIVLTLTAAAHQMLNAVRSLSKLRIPKSSDKPTFVCDLCVNTSRLHESFNMKGCTHFYCYDCIIKYIVSKLDNNITSIKCPETGCQGVLEFEESRHILPEAVLERWAVALCESGISHVEKFYCPFKDCSALLLCEGRDQYGLAECPNCKRDICVKCGVPYHSEFSCEEFKDLSKDGDADAMLTSVAMKKRWRRCPACNYYVEKSGGCASMLCRCGRKFCYTCGQSKAKYHLCSLPDAY